MLLEKLSTNKTDSIQDIAIKLHEEQQRLLNIEKDPKERTIFVLGSKCVGKSTAIGNFLGREESTRPTLALEYSYGRRTSNSQGIQKEVLNFWELGSCDNAEELIDIPSKSHGIQHFSVVLFVDLSQPKRVAIELDSACKRLTNTYAHDQNEIDSSALKEKAVQRFGKEHQDLATLDLFPFPLIIVGGKYDIFMNFDPEIKKHVCRYLRCMTHKLGAALLFYSNQIPKLSKTLKDTISHLGFGSPTLSFRSFTVDYNGPLSVWFGTDSWDQIGVIPLSMELIGLAFCKEVPQENCNKTTLPDDPAKDPGFLESVIDEMRHQKNEELATLIKEIEMRGKFETTTQ